LNTNFNKILLKFFRLPIGSKLTKPWTVNARRPKQNFVKKKLTNTGKGGVPFNGRGCMSFEIPKVGVQRLEGCTRAMDLG
jgi:hypothetical protein